MRLPPVINDHHCQIGVHKSLGACWAKFPQLSRTLPWMCFHDEHLHQAVDDKGGSDSCRMRSVLSFWLLHVQGTSLWTNVVSVSRDTQPQRIESKTSQWYTLRLPMRNNESLGDFMLGFKSPYFFPSQDSQSEECWLRIVQCATHVSSFRDMPIHSSDQCTCN